MVCQKCFDVEYVIRPFRRLFWGVLVRHSLWVSHAPIIVLDGELYSKHIATIECER